MTICQILMSFLGGWPSGCTTVYFVFFSWVVCEWFYEVVLCIYTAETTTETETESLNSASKEVIGKIS